jgi:serine/threonine protein kinase
MGTSIPLPARMILGCTRTSVAGTILVPPTPEVFLPESKLGAPMKICPQCETGYHDSHETCPTHGGLLSEIRDLRPGMLIRGTYRIVRKLGKGGMGAVYLAQHTLMDEPRALKFLSQELSEDENFTSRFLREVRTLRQVRNRNVVDCGDPERAEDGALFFSMEFVDGPNLRDFLKTAPKPFDVALALNITHGIAEGLGAAHAKGMVHRDIKPENILMARDREIWIPKIADFGIVATRESSQHTQTGSTLLTMAYAAPEQWMGMRAADLDGRADLYALGGVLFEMLAGQTVFEAENYHGWAQKHLSAAPIAPSSLRPELVKWRGLDEFVLRLLAKDRNARPANVADFLALMTRIDYDPSIPVRMPDPYAPTMIFTPPLPAAPPAAPSATGIQPGGSSSQISRLEAVTSLPNASSLSSSAGPGETFARPAQAGARPAQAGTPAAPRPPTIPSPGPSQAAPQPSESQAPAPPTSDEARRTGVSSTSAQSGAASTRTGAHTTSIRGSAIRTSRGTVVNRLGAATDPAAKKSRGVPAWILVAGLLLVVAGAFAFQHYSKPKAKFATLQSQTAPIVSVAFNPSGLVLASASRENSIQLWDMNTLKATATLADNALAIAYSPDGRYLASADWDKSVKLWDAASGQVLATLSGHTDQVLAVAFSPDGRVLASGGRDRTIRLWDVAGDKILRTLAGNTSDVNAIAWSPDGHTLASGGADNLVKLWDSQTGKVVSTLQGHTRPVNSIAFSPDGRTVASGSDDMTINLWDPAAGKLTRTLHGHTDAVRAIAIAPDGQTLASASADSTIRLWDLSGSSTEAFKTLEGHSAAVLSLAFNQNGTNLASGSADNTVRIWFGPAARN